MLFRSHALSCPACGTSEEKFVPVGSLSFEQGRCPKDGAMRTVKAIHSFSGTESFGSRTLDQLGLPLFDVFSARACEKEVSYLIAGDQELSLGTLAAACS